MSDLFNLNNRELSIAVWAIAFLLFIFFNNKTRSASISLIKIFFAKKLLILNVVTLLYIFATILALHILNIWDFSCIKITLIWTVCVAFAMLFRLRKERTVDFFKQNIRDNIKIIVFLEFIANLYVFSFWFEIIFIPFSALAGIIAAIAESDPKHNTTKQIINYTFIIIGIFFISYASYNIITNFDDFATKENLIDFTLPILLTAMFIPFIYLIALYLNYESLFLRMSFIVKDKELLSYAKRKIFLSFGINLNSINNWSNHFNSVYINEKKDLDEAIIAFKKKETQN